MNISPRRRYRWLVLVPLLLALVSCAGVREAVYRRFSCGRSRAKCRALTRAGSELTPPLPACASGVAGARSRYSG